MITLLIGDNSFEIERALREMTKNFAGVAEKLDGGSLRLEQLPDILMGNSLFATTRMVIIRGLSANKSLWSVFGDWLSKISDDISLILIESKPDKRTAAFKALKEKANIIEFESWTERDIAKAEKWVEAEAKKLGFDLDRQNARILVQRVGVDQWQLSHALDKLSLSDVVSADVIKDIIDASPTENVFNLFETALRGDAKELKNILKTLEKSEDVYRLSALLFTQAFQLAVIASAAKSDNVARDFGIHPYVVSKLETVAKRIGKKNVSKVISIFAAMDDDMKLSRAEPWLLVERALMKVANL